MAKKGRDFEMAVYQFVHGLDPHAEILFDQKVPDRDTGSLRQVDVWAKAKVLGQFSITILISCKDHRRKLSVTDIDTFLGERRSTGASYGILFSRGGFSQNAIIKARKHEIQCCELLDGQQPKRVTDFSFRFYAAYPQGRLYVIDRVGHSLRDAKWSDYLRIGVGLGKRHAWLATHIADALNKAQADGLSMPGAPRDHISVLNFDTKAKQARRLPFDVIVSNIWERYRAKADSYQLWGALNRTGSTFHGSMACPAFPTRGEPAFGWAPFVASEAVGGQGVWMVLRSQWNARTVFDGVGAQPIASNVAFGPTTALPNLEELIERLQK